jgi:hypothetical protein
MSICLAMSEVIELPWFGGGAYRKERHHRPRPACISEWALLNFAQREESHTESSAPVEMKELVEEARKLVQGTFAVDHEAKAALANIIKVGTSAGGARAKAVIVWNPKMDEVRSGQFDTAPGFEHWLLKFDGSEKTKSWGREMDTDGSNTLTT